MFEKSQKKKKKNKAVKDSLGNIFQTCYKDRNKHFFLCKISHNQTQF